MLKRIFASLVVVSVILGSAASTEMSFAAKSKKGSGKYKGKKMKGGKGYQKGSFINYRKHKHHKQFRYKSFNHEPQGYEWSNHYNSAGFCVEWDGERPIGPCIMEYMNRAENMVPPVNAPAKTEPVIDNDKKAKKGKGKKGKYKSKRRNRKK